MKISEVKYDQKKSHIIINTDCDRTFVIGFTDFYARKSLYDIGMEIDDDLLYVTENLQERVLAREKALSSLSYSDKSTKGLIRLLCDCGFSQEISKEVVITLKKEGYIDDKGYCSHCYDMYIDKGYGPVRIKYELYKKGFTQRMVDYTFEIKNSDFGQILVELMATKAQSLTERVKIYDYFYSRGFDFDTINYAYHSIFS